MVISDDALTAAFSWICPSAASFSRRSIGLCALPGIVSRARNSGVVHGNMRQLRSGFGPGMIIRKGVSFGSMRASQKKYAFLSSDGLTRSYAGPEVRFKEVCGGIALAGIDRE